MKIAVITFDVERDCPPYLESYRGIEEGLPRILELLDAMNVKATFFTTANVAVRYPNIVKMIVDRGHELGCHGYVHERLDKLDADSAFKAVCKATRILSRYAEVVSFRAPNLKLPVNLLKRLKRCGYSVDSSLASYKPPFPQKPFIIDGIVELPATVTSSILRLPWSVQYRVHKRLLGRGLIVYFSHPWEYVDMSSAPIRFDCRFNTGWPALELLSKLISYLRSVGYELLTAKEAAFKLRESFKKAAPLNSEK